MTFLYRITFGVLCNVPIKENICLLLKSNVILRKLVEYGVYFRKHIFTADINV